MMGCAVILVPFWSSDPIRLIDRNGKPMTNLGFHNRFLTLLIGPWDTKDIYHEHFLWNCLQVNATLDLTDND